MRKLRNDSKPIDINLARKMYRDEDKTLSEIASFFQVAIETLHRRFVRFEINRKSKSEVMKRNWQEWRTAHPERPKHRRKRINGENVGIHRMKAEKVLDRPLKSNEIVHHIDGNRLNNDNSNLLICSRSYHSWLHRRIAKKLKEKANEQR